VRRYLAKTRKRTGGLVCLRCEGRFAGRDAYDRHLVIYPDGDWCHLPEEVGLVVGNGGWARLPAGPLHLDPGILAGGGVPTAPYRVQRDFGVQDALQLAA
jgi:hypothetical protein